MNDKVYIQTMQTLKCKKCDGSGKTLDHAAVGEDLRKQRKLAGITMTSVAKKMGYHLTYVLGLENGYQRWTPEKIAAYRKAITT